MVEKRRLLPRGSSAGNQEGSRRRKSILAKAAVALTAGWLTFAGSTELFNSYTPMPLAFINKGD